VNVLKIARVWRLSASAGMPIPEQQRDAEQAAVADSQQVLQAVVGRK
jgi:hypothetical protein